MSGAMTAFHAPVIVTGHHEVDLCFRIALGDLLGNCRTQPHDPLGGERPCLDAGLEYGVWTRDSAINAWYGAGLLCPEAVTNALLLRQIEEPAGTRLGGQYWDCIVFAAGAWQQYCITGDRAFLQHAFPLLVNSLRYLEETELDESDGLFRGAACYGDGTSAYPDRYVSHKDGGIHKWVEKNPPERHPTGFGLPMKTLSTNCLYKRAYEVAAFMAAELGETADPQWSHRAEGLRAAIEKHFWNARNGRYDYLLDAQGRDEAQEGLGHAFAVLCGVTSSEHAGQLLRGLHRTPHGLPCLWPTYGRYTAYGSSHCGRHSGPVWPHVNGFFALAAARHGACELLEDELRALTRNVWRDREFRELYHPETGEPYGGLQESELPEKPWQQWCHVAELVRHDGWRMVEWYSASRQSWCASAYFAMLVQGCAGLCFEPGGIRLRPCLPEWLGGLEIRHLRYRESTLHLKITGAGTAVRTLRVNGTVLDEAFLEATLRGEHEVEVEVEVG